MPGPSVAMTAIFRCAALLIMTVGAQLVAAQDWAHARNNVNGPLVLQSEGSVFVGGQDKSSDALNAAAASAGTVSVNQMYVQFQIPAYSSGRKTPVIIHGCCLSAKSWKETPDGRTGWKVEEFY